MKEYIKHVLLKSQKHRYKNIVIKTETRVLLRIVVKKNERRVNINIYCTNEFGEVNTLIQKYLYLFQN